MIIPDSIRKFMKNVEDWTLILSEIDEIASLNWPKHINDSFEAKFQTSFVHWKYTCHYICMYALRYYRISIVDRIFIKLLSTL